MKILLNDREEEFNCKQMTVTEMLDIKKFTYKMRIIKLNGVLVPKEEYDKTIIRNGDQVKMLYLMSGG